MENRADIGIIGGTGIYDPELFSAKREIKVHTPYGETSDLVTVGEYSGVKAAFVPRHGRGHRIPPHRRNNRGNVWGLEELGVERRGGPSAVGGGEGGVERGEGAS